MEADRVKGLGKGWHNNWICRYGGLDFFRDLSHPAKRVRPRTRIGTKWNCMKGKCFAIELWDLNTAMHEKMSHPSCTAKRHSSYMTRSLAQPSPSDRKITTGGLTQLSLNAQGQRHRARVTFLNSRSAPSLFSRPSGQHWSCSHWMAWWGGDAVAVGPGC